MSPTPEPWTLPIIGVTLFKRRSGEGKTGFGFRSVDSDQKNVENKEWQFCWMCLVMDREIKWLELCYFDHYFQVFNQILIVILIDDSWISLSCVKLSDFLRTYWFISYYCSYYISYSLLFPEENWKYINWKFWQTFCSITLLEEF